MEYYGFNFKLLTGLISSFLNCTHKRRPFTLLGILKMPFYAVARGKTPGIFMTWPDCESQVKGFSGAKYKKFNTINEAQEYINIHGGNITSNKSSKSSNSTNAKRSYSTLSSFNNNHRNVPTTLAPSKSFGTSSDFTDSDGSDDLNEILNKQMDDIQKRIKGVERNVNNIIKKSTGGTARKSILIDPPQPKKQKGNQQFEIDNQGFVQVYTDGACSSNGRTGAKAGLGVYWGDNHPLNISEPVSGRATNNCGEIQAATRAIQLALQHGVTHLQINTDSKFLINSVTKWIPGWKRKGWKLKSGEPVKNEIDFKELDTIKDQLAIKWNYVEAHQGILGNEMADRLAKDGAAMYSQQLLLS